MKSVIKTGATLGAILVGALAVTSPALATENFHGNICQPQEPGQANRFRYPGVGIEALSSGTVACPLVTDGSNIQKIEVNVGSTSITQSTECLIFPVDWNGSNKGSQHFTIAPGSKFKTVTIPDYFKGTYVAYHVGCDLPTGQVLTSINVYK